MKVIADHPPDEMYKAGVEIDCQCARCGSSCERIECHDCDGEGCYEDEDGGCERRLITRYQPRP